MSTEPVPDMPNAKPRRPPLSTSLVYFLPSLIVVLSAAWIPRHYEPYSLALLLAGASLSMAAVVHALGFGCDASFAHAAVRRGAAHLIALAIYAAAVFVLVAWPLLALARMPSLGGALGLALALAIALVLLWRLWPVFGLVFTWDDAFPAGTEHSWITAALARSARFAQHLTRDRDLFVTHFLPAAAAQLVIAFAALTLAGLGASLPDEIRTASLFVFAVLVLPLASLVLADRTLRLLFGARNSRDPATPPHARAPGTAPVSTASGKVRDAPRDPQSATAPPQAELDEGLLAAVRAGDLAAAEAWLARGASPNAQPAVGAHDRRPALMLAVELSDTRVLRTLIARGAAVNHAHAGLTPLLAATRCSSAGRHEAVTSLIANGADPALADAGGNTPLHHAALCTDPAIAAILVDAQAPLETQNRDLATPLAVAAAVANWPLVEFLAVHGAMPDPALAAAAGIAEDDAAGVRLLLRHRARVNALDARGRSALLAAATEGHVAICRALLDAGADPETSGGHGTTPLMEAARAGATAVIALLAERHPDVHARDQYGRTALTLACQSPHGNRDCVRALLAMGADPGCKGSDGRSSIDHASGAGRWDLVALLDPAARLPASHTLPEQPDPGADTPRHLLDALRFAHWSVAQRFSERARGWQMAELAKLYLELAEHGDDAPRTWLLEHGLAPEAVLDDGSRLFDRLLDQLPGATRSVQQLLDAGATPAGAGRLAPALARLGETRHGEPLALALLERGADVFGADADGRTPLHHASRPGLHSVLAALLQRGVDPNAHDHTGATPLHMALDGDPEAVLPQVKLLIAHGADPENPAAGGETPLGLALARGATRIEYWLRWNDWQLPGRPLRGVDLPSAAADADAVARLLELGLPVDTRDARGATALLRAAGTGSLQSVQRLLAAGADPRAVVETGASALSAATSARHADIVRTLVGGGVAVDERHADGVTALMIAAALGYPDIVATVRELGAQPDAVDANGRTALHVAAGFCFESRDSLTCRRLLDALLAGNPGPDAADHAGATPLLMLLGVHAKPDAACDGTHLGALLPVLLDVGADPRHADEHGVTALHACAMHALFEPARVLLARGADRAARDCMQRTAAEVARVLGYIDLAQELAPRRAVLLNAPVVAPLMTHPD